MSTNLYWQPRNTVNEIKGDRLKQILKKGWEGWEQPHGVEHVIDADALDYLHGLDDAGVEGADELIEALSVHESIRVFEQ